MRSFPNLPTWRVVIHSCCDFSITWFNWVTTQFQHLLMSLFISFFSGPTSSWPRRRCPAASLGWAPPPTARSSLRSPCAAPPSSRRWTAWIRMAWCVSVGFFLQIYSWDWLFGVSIFVCDIWLLGRYYFWDPCFRFGMMQWTTQSAMKQPAARCRVENGSTFQRGICSRFEMWWRHWRWPDLVMLAISGGPISSEKLDGQFWILKGHVSWWRRTMNSTDCYPVWLKLGLKLEESSLSGRRLSDSMLNVLVIFLVLVLAAVHFHLTESDVKSVLSRLLAKWQETNANICERELEKRARLEKELLKTRCNNFRKVHGFAIHLCFLASLATLLGPDPCSADLKQLIGPLSGYAMHACIQTGILQVKNSSHLSIVQALCVSSMALHLSGAASQAEIEVLASMEKMSVVSAIFISVIFVDWKMTFPIYVSGALVLTYKQWELLGHATNVAPLVCSTLLSHVAVLGVLVIIVYTMQSYIAERLDSDDTSSLLLAFRRVLRGLCDGDLVLDRRNHRIVDDASYLERLLNTKKKLSEWFLRLVPGFRRTPKVSGVSGQRNIQRKSSHHAVLLEDSLAGCGRSGVHGCFRHKLWSSSTRLLPLGISSWSGAIHCPSRCRGQSSELEARSWGSWAWRASASCS